MIDPRFEMEPEDIQDGSQQTTLSFAGDEIQGENKTQKDDGHTPVSRTNDACFISGCSALWPKRRRDTGKLRHWESFRILQGLR